MIDPDGGTKEIRDRFFSIENESMIIRKHPLFKMISHNLLQLGIGRPVFNIYMINLIYRSWLKENLDHSETMIFIMEFNIKIM